MQALEQKKLFIIDYHDLLLPYVSKVRQIEGTTLYGSRALFFLTPNGTLKPLAIELTRPPIEGKPQWKQVFTPTSESTGRWLWRLAKVHFLAHDSGYHQLVSHWYMPLPWFLFWIIRFYFTRPFKLIPWICWMKSWTTLWMPIKQLCSMLQVENSLCNRTLHNCNKSATQCNAPHLQTITSSFPVHNAYQCSCSRKSHQCGGDHWVFILTRQVFCGA